MVVKVRRWSPWAAGPPSSAVTRKFHVAVKPTKLEQENGVAVEEESDKVVAIKVKWKGEPKFFPLMAQFQRNSRHKKEMITREKVVKRGWRAVGWDDDPEDQSWFEHPCCFSVVASDRDDDRHKFGPWEVAFNVVYGEKTDSKAKTMTIGRVSMNIAEIAGNLDSSSVEHKLPIKLHIDGTARDANLTVLFNFVEIREPQTEMAMIRGGSMRTGEGLLGGNEHKESVKGRRRALSQEDITLDSSDESSTFEVKDRGAPQTSSSTSKKAGWFSRTSRRFSFKRAKTKEEKLGENTESCSNDQSAQIEDGGCPEGSWVEKELISRDGQTKLKAPVFFASFDQRSDKAAGESACTALVAVISHWLHSNSNAMPNRIEFDDLIMQGSSEWRKLCQNAAYVDDFPNKHFDLETVLRDQIRPISISNTKSFVGFFGAEKFESLKGAMSFDDIWNEISSNAGAEDERIYIVSWNDHFFVLKAEANAYYVIDTLGERLSEGCNQAYILKFDDSAVMLKQGSKETAEASKNEESKNEEIVCNGKECCREFLKRFLAAIPLQELEEEEKKKAVSYFSLHHRLQIEFNYSCLSPKPPSPSSSSPFSSSPDSSSMCSPIP